MDWVVSDSSTLIHLSSIGKLSLLKSLFGEITIPQAVWKEVVEHGANRPGAAEVAKAFQEGWIKISTPQNTAFVHLLSRELDHGESQAIALAIEKQASLLLIDESEGRKIASMYKIPKTGVVGILLSAKQQGLIYSLKTELDTLRHKGNFRMDEKLYQHILKASNEA
jgi:predicted nucleic acid-binding protein